MLVRPHFSKWPGAAFDPETNILYLNYSNEAEWFSMEAAELEKEIPLTELEQKIYQSICSNCHGFDSPGRLPGMELPALSTVKERLSREEAFNVIIEGRGSMPSFSSFSDLEIESLVAFLYNDQNDVIVDTEDIQFTRSGNIP